MALHARPPGAVFWVASNDGVYTGTADVSDKVLRASQSLVACKAEPATSGGEAELLRNGYVIRISSCKWTAPVINRCVWAVPVILE